MVTLIIGFVVIFSLQTYIIIHLIVTLKSIMKLVKASSLWEYMELVENEKQEPVKDRYVDISNVDKEELMNIEINAEDIYRGIVYKEDEATNKKENIIS